MHGYGSSKRCGTIYRQKSPPVAQTFSLMDVALGTDTGIVRHCMALYGYLAQHTMQAAIRAEALSYTTAFMVGNDIGNAYTAGITPSLRGHFEI